MGGYLPWRLVFFAYLFVLQASVALTAKRGQVSRSLILGRSSRGGRKRSGEARAGAKRDWPVSNDAGPQPPTPGDLALDVVNCMIEDCDPNCLCEKIVWQSDYAGPGPPAMYQQIESSSSSSSKSSSRGGATSTSRKTEESSSEDPEVRAPMLPHPNWASQPVPGTQTNVCQIWAQRGRLAPDCAPTCELIWQQVDSAQGADPNVCYKAAAEARALWVATRHFPARLPPRLPRTTTTPTPTTTRRST